MRKVEYRITKGQLSDVCKDCAEFLNHPCVECDDCPVNRLKLRFNKKLPNHTKR